MYPLLDAALHCALWFGSGSWTRVYELPLLTAVDLPVSTLLVLAAGRLYFAHSQLVGWWVNSRASAGYTGVGVMATWPGTRYLSKLDLFVCLFGQRFQYYGINKPRVFPYYWKWDPILLERAHLHDPIVLDILSHTMENIEYHSSIGYISNTME